MSHAKLAFEPHEWHPLPGGWVIAADTRLSENRHLIPMVPARASTTEDCNAPAESMRELGIVPYLCSRSLGHTGRHAAAIRMRRRWAVVAVWADESAETIMNEIGASESERKAIERARRQIREDSGRLLGDDENPSDKLGDEFADLDTTEQEFDRMWEEATPADDERSSDTLGNEFDDLGTTVTGNEEGDRMKVYVVMIKDRHVDPDCELFSKPVEAMARAKQIADRSAQCPEDVEEEEIEGWLYSAVYSTEGDSVWVVEKELETLLERVNKGLRSL